jgi:hypothetical protein
MDLYHTSRPSFSYMIVHNFCFTKGFLFLVNFGVAIFIFNYLFQVCLNFECGVLKDDEPLSTKHVHMIVMVACHIHTCC